MTFASANCWGRSFTTYPGDEPALTAANLVKQTMLSAPFVWPWNRQVITFNTVIGQQDYVEAVSTFGWIESASFQDTGVTPHKWRQMGNRISLELDSTAGQPDKIAAQLDDNTGNITFRLMPVPDAVYPISVTIQKNPVLFTATTDTWTPIPDRLSQIYTWGFLSLMYLFSDDPRFASANQKFIANLLAVAQGLTDTQVNIFLNDWASITGDPQVREARLQQAHGARGV